MMRPSAVLLTFFPNLYGVGGLTELNGSYPMLMALGLGCDEAEPPLAAPEVRAMMSRVDDPRGTSTGALDGPRAALEDSSDRPTVVVACCRDWMDDKGSYERGCTRRGC
jgi:hypothetical protein